MGMKVLTLTTTLGPSDMSAQRSLESPLLFRRVALSCIPATSRIFLRVQESIRAGELLL